MTTIDGEALQAAMLARAEAAERKACMTYEHLARELTLREARIWRQAAEDVAMRMEAEAKP